MKFSATNHQCHFVEKRYAVDPEDLEIYHNYHCIKAEGHSGKHSFYKNPAKFHKDWRSVQQERQEILQKMRMKIKNAKIN